MNDREAWAKETALAMAREFPNHSYQSIRKRIYQVLGTQPDGMGKPLPRPSTDPFVEFVIALAEWHEPRTARERTEHHNARYNRMRNAAKRLVQERLAR